jgi:DNA-binding NarL/FixJ family response regulator
MTSPIQAQAHILEPEAAPVQVLLADDHTLVRAGLRKLLEAMPNVEVIGEAADGVAILEMAELLQPQLVLMDIAMPGLNGLEATQRLRIALPNTQVMILSMHQNEEYVKQALRHGASAYLLKDAATTELELAIKAVLRGEIYLSPAVSKGVMSDYVQRLRSEETADEILTPRQLEVLKLLAQGQSSKEIARLLDLSTKTVDTHRSQLMKQLGIHEVTGLVRYAIRVGLISSDC